MAISNDDTLAITASDRWCEFKKTPNNYAGIVAFTAWLGDPLFRDGEGNINRNKIVDMNNPEVRRKVELINSSPNWYALIKVMDIRREE